MTETDFERNDGLDHLSSHDLERVAFEGAAVPAAASTAPPPRPLKHCHACGSKIDKEAEMCVKCGVRQSPAASHSPGVQVNVNQSVGHGAGYASTKSRMAAALLAIFLGGLGAHKFYLGKPIQGLLYLVFCWTFIPGVIGFIEGIIYLVTSEEDFARKYGARVY